jgi:hypothetical protein
MQSSAASGIASAVHFVGVVGCLAALSCDGQVDAGAGRTAVASAGAPGAGGLTISLGLGGYVSSSGLNGSGGRSFAGAGGSGGYMSFAQPLDAGPQPIVPCGLGAAGGILDGAICAPPPSHCVDENTLAYYTDGQCVDARCRWKVEFLMCPTGCFSDGCRQNITRTR